MSDVGDQRRYYERMMDEIATEHRNQIDQLEAENANLRELVRDLHRRLSNANLCAMCPDSEACCLGLGWEQCTMLDDLETRMRKLGVEVDR